MDTILASSSITIYVAQAGVAGAVGFILAALGRSDRSRGLPLWGLAFLMLAGHHLAAAVGRELAADPSLVAVRTVVSGIGLAFGYLFPFLMLAGASRIAGKEWFASDRTVVLWVAGVALVGGLTVLPFATAPFPSSGRMLVRVGVRSLVVGLVLLASVALMLRRAGRRPARWGLVGSVVLMALLQLDFATGTLGGSGLTSVLDGTILRLLELALLAVTGLSTMGWLADAERVRGDRAEEEWESTARELDAERERAHFLFEHAVDVIGEIRRDGVIVRFSPSVAPILGSTPEETTGRSILDFVHPDDRAKTVDRLQAAGQGRNPRSFQIRLLNEETGAFRWMEIVGSPVDGGDRVVVNARDVTQRRALEERLLRAQKLEVTGRLVGSISHDFNNVLMVVGQGTEFALEELPPEMTDVRRELEAIEDAADRARRLVRGLLSFTRRTRTTREVIDLNGLLEELNESFLGRLVGGEVHLDLKTAEEPLEVLIDRAELESVVLNLVVNARDAMPEGGDLRIRTESVEEGRSVRLIVADTGMGIPEDRLDSIFDPFYSTKGENGTGLGLATVAGVVRAAEGRVRVESTPGSGSRFEIDLPRAGTSGEAAATP